MTEEKLIVIGCDDSVGLSALHNSIKSATSFPHHIISATRMADLINILKGMPADLVILSFRNNQLALNDIGLAVKKPELPVLCLTRKFENTPLSWNKSNIVFTVPMEYIDHSEYLSLRINSIFLLKGLQASKPAAASLAAVAIEKAHHSGANDMSRYVLELDQKVEVLLKVKDRIINLYTHVDEHTRTELISIVNSIKLSAHVNKFWDDFKLYFDQTNPDFLRQLSKKYPSLTPIDLKYCCYLKMDMSNDDIKNILGINQESVRTHKYRLKRKMLLPNDLDLRAYLRSVG